MSIRFVVLAIVIGACAGDRARPEWPARDGGTLVGRGEGATAAEAHAAALADLAAQVRAEVHARTERVASAAARGGQVDGDVFARHEVAVEARLEHGELARRRSVRRDGSGRTEVTLMLARAEWASRRRADAAADARVVLRALDSLTRPPASPVAVRWHELGRAVAAGRRWLDVERDAVAIGGDGSNATGRIADAISALSSARDAAARAASCLVAIDGSDTLQAVAAAACGAQAPSLVLGRRASDARTLTIAGRVERTVVREGDVVFAESRLVLGIEGDGRRLETLVLGGPGTRRGALDATRATAASDAVLSTAVADALEARFGG